MDVDPRWYDGFFEREWLDYLAFEQPAERTVQELDFAVERLALEPGARILDLACGHGRHSLELARRGFDVTGVDLSPRSLELAREAAAAESLEVDFVEADMREIDFDGGFDAVVNLFSSFGYFSDASDDRRVCERVERALAPGGAFLLDVVNPLGLTRRYQERSWNRGAEDTLVLEDREWDLLTGRTSVIWTFIRPDGARSELRHSLRLYTPWELAAMLEGVGLSVEDAWGGFEGTPLTHESWRLIVLARKSA